ncbi:MAG: GHKL domain-containing protein [Clostridia bacterium]|nr:GHKL domain-containing protein [Clostridia bacterium]
MAYYIVNFLQFIMISVFVCKNLTAKLNKYLAGFMIAAPFMFSMVMQQNISWFSPVISVAVGWLCFVTVIALAFKEAPKDKIFVAAFVMLISYAVATAMTALGSWLKMDLFSVNWPLMFFHHGLFALLLLIFTFIRRKIDIKNYSLTAFLIMSVFQLLFAEVAILYVVYGGNPFKDGASTVLLNEDNKFVFIVIAAAALLCVITDFVMMIMVKKLSQGEVIKEELKLREYQNELNLDYYKSLEKNSEQARKLRHDMANLIQTVQILTERKDDTQIAEQLISQLNNEISEIHLEKYTENSLINTIAVNKAELCRKKKIDFDFKIDIPSKLNFEEIDICKAFVNVIDNAINAVELLEKQERNLKLSSYMDGDSLVICSKNPYNESADKKSHKGQGLGKKILKDIALKYNGEFLVEEKAGFYTAVLTLEPKT